MSWCREHAFVRRLHQLQYFGIGSVQKDFIILVDGFPPAMVCVRGGPAGYTLHTGRAVRAGLKKLSKFDKIINYDIKTLHTVYYCICFIVAC